MKPETKFWNLIKKHTDSYVHWSRLESLASPGVPDLNGCYESKEIWIELKVLTTRTDKSFPKWRPLQIAWQTSRTRVGGCVWNLVHHPSSASVLIMDGQHLARRLMDRDPIWDGRRLMSEMDGDGWKALLDQMCSGRVN